MHSIPFLNIDILTCHVYLQTFSILNDFRDKDFYQRDRGFLESTMQMCIQFISWLSIYIFSSIYYCIFFLFIWFSCFVLLLAFLPFSSPFLFSITLCERHSTRPRLCQKTTATLLLWAIFFPYIPIWRIAYDNDFKTGQLALLSVLAYVDVCYSFWPQYQTRLLSFLAVKAPANESTETLPLHWSEGRCITICRHPDVLRLWKWQLWG